jgi:two-component system response regulator GlrR
MNEPKDSPPASNLVNMVGRSAAFRRVERLIRKIADYDTAVLIEGETGTGKELAARSVHYLSARRGMPFVPVNCGAIPDSLVENELFGHRRGAFTGASDTRQGLIAQAQGGTLFLDEIDALSPKAQVTLLRFMQDQEYRPLGSAHAECGNVRVIAASNANLLKLAETGEFRSDLLFRLKVLSVELPPVRERQGDVELLAQHYLQKFSQQYGKPAKSLHLDTLAWMNKYDWPGNVRELEHLIHREFLLSDGPTIHLHCESRDIDRRKRPDRRGVNLEAGFGVAKTQAIVQFEKRFLKQLLFLSDGNVTRAAKLAGKERRALGKLLKKHGLEKSEYSSGPGPRAAWPLTNEFLPVQDEGLDGEIDRQRD